jgi:2-polyprenyl-3-methyl-5-hydroxy-6-metoxy-1,4-benzoquinol methylase
MADLLKDDLEYTSCPICGLNDFEKELTSKDFLFSRREFSVVRCRSCGLLFTNPRVRENQIPKYYFPDYYPYKDVKQSTFIQKAKRILGKLPGDIHLRILEVLKSFNAKDVLEIGPANGSLLFFLKEHGFEVTGVEIDRNCAEKIRGKGIPCLQGDLNENMREIGQKRFDAVILCHVLEHLYRPKETLKNIYNLLNEQGIIYLNLPNSGSFEARIFGKYWLGFDLPRHVVHYDTETIGAVLFETGFHIYKLENVPDPSFIIQSMAYCFFKKGTMPEKLYYLLYYPLKLLGPLYVRLIGSSVMSIVAGKVKRANKGAHRH